MSISFQARVYLLSAGFSLAFGSMFAKTYRVHRIFTRTGSIFKDKMLQDTQLISLVGGLLLLDGLVVTLWVATDPMERHLNNLTLEISSIDRSVVYQPQVRISNACVCVFPVSALSYVCHLVVQMFSSSSLVAYVNFIQHICFQ